MIPAQVAFMLENFYHENRVEKYSNQRASQASQESQAFRREWVVSMLTYFVFVILTHAMLRSNYKTNVRRGAQS